MDCIVHGVAKSWTRLSDFHFTSFHGLSDEGGNAPKTALNELVWGDQCPDSFH